MKKQTLTGVIEGSPRGYAFLISEGRDDDAFISAKDLNGAIHGDKVLCEMVSYYKNGGEARVVKILEPRSRRIVGVFKREKGAGAVIPDDNKIAKEIFIPPQFFNDAKSGDKVVCTLQDTSRKIMTAKITEILGKPEDKGVDILSIIRAYNLYETFPNKVINEAKDTPKSVSKADTANRRDLRGELIFTIDGDDSRDFDDAVSVKIKDNGNFILGVHIADVSHYVKSGSALDAEAFKRGTSVYFCDRTLPMLPENLSNGICSLTENDDRLCLSCVMEISDAGKIIKHEIFESVIKSKARLTYSLVAKMLDGDGADDERIQKYDFTLPMLKDMKILAKILFNKRKARGNIDFDLPESEIILDEKGKTVAVEKKPRLISHRIIEEFMLAANETVAEEFCKLKAAFIYRVHEEPPQDKLEALFDFLDSIAVSFPNAKIKRDSVNRPKPSDFSALLASVEGRSYAHSVNRVTLRSMSKASYMPVNKGHFGLAAEYYCHFTSPIRRYPDLAIHRIIKEYIHSGAGCFNRFRGFVADAASESSERERLAEKAERDVDDLKKAEFMQNKIGKKYDGIISGVTEFGIFVELENTVEGMIKLERLDGDRYRYDRKTMSVSNGIFTYKIGDPIKIKVAGVYGMKVEFVPVKGGAEEN